MKTTTFGVHTGHAPAVTDITGQCAQFARQASGGDDGLLHVFVPHATAGLALLELGSGSDDDLLGFSPSCCPPTIAGGTRTARADMAGRTSSPRSWRRTRRSPSSAAGWPSAPGSPSR